MGSEASKENNKEFNSLIAACVKEVDLSDLHFGQIQVYHLNENLENRIFTKQFNTTTVQEFTALTKHFEKRKLFEQINLIKLMAVKTNIDTKLCSENNSCLAAFDFYSDTLLEELIKRQRRQTNSPYSESHMWILIEQIVDPCYYLEQQGMFHADIRPYNIFLDLNGAIRTFDWNIFPDGKTGYQKYITSQEFAYLSPQQLQAAKDQIFNPKIDQVKADVYAFGMTLLESGTLLGIKFYQFNSN